MKLIIISKSQYEEMQDNDLWDEEWKIFEVHPLEPPSEIRARVESLCSQEEEKDLEFITIATMNRTVLDMVTTSNAKIVGPIILEDVFMFSDENF